jgi:hypothetical protein
VASGAAVPPWRAACRPSLFDELAQCVGGVGMQGDGSFFETFADRDPQPWMTVCVVVEAVDV